MKFNGPFDILLFNFEAVTGVGVTNILADLLKVRHYMAPFNIGFPRHLKTVTKEEISISVYDYNGPMIEMNERKINFQLSWDK